MDEPGHLGDNIVLVEVIIGRRYFAINIQMYPFVGQLGIHTEPTIRYR